MDLLYKKSFKRVIITLLTVCMALSFFSIIPANTIKVQASVKNINLGTGALMSPTKGYPGQTNWIGDKVYFGQDPVHSLWRVLDPNTGLIFADDSVT